MWWIVVGMTTVIPPQAERGWVPADLLQVRLAQVRNRMGWNAKEAAVACGFPAQSWRNWEAGQQPRDLVGVCERISDVTGVNVEWLMRGARANYADAMSWCLADVVAA